MLFADFRLDSNIHHNEYCCFYVKKQTQKHTLPSLMLLLLSQDRYAPLFYLWLFWNRRDLICLISSKNLLLIFFKLDIIMRIFSNLFISFFINRLIILAELFFCFVFGSSSNLSAVNQWNPLLPRTYHTHTHIYKNISIVKYETKYHTIIQC